MNADVAPRRGWAIVACALALSCAPAIAVEGERPLATPSVRHLKMIVTGAMLGEIASCP